MYCSKCGKLIPEDANFCSYCGAKTAAGFSGASPSAESSPEEHEKLARDARKGTLVYLHDILSMEFCVHRLEQEWKLEKRKMVIHDYWFFWKEYRLSPPIRQSQFAPFERLVLSYSYRLNQYYFAFLDRSDDIQFFDYQGNFVNHKYGKPCCGSSELDPVTRKKLMTLPQIKNKLFSGPVITNSDDLWWGNWNVAANDYRSEPFAQVKTIIEQFEHAVSVREQEYQARLPALQKKMAGLEKEIAEAKGILQKLYDVNVIPAKFRNLGCVYFIHEFYSTSNSALSSVFLHLDLDKIQSQLNTVIQNQQKSILQQAVLIAQNEEILAQNQRLFEELSHMRADTGRIQAQLGEIRDSSIETGQWAKIAAGNAEACAWIGLANYLK